MRTSVLLASLATAAAIIDDGVNELGSHAGFPVSRALPGAPTWTYMSVLDPLALNLDGSIYGIAVCLSTTSTANW